MPFSKFVLLIPVLNLSWAAGATIFHPSCTVPLDAVNFVSFSNVRGTLDIVWSCLFTILVCSWAVQHPNIPVQDPPNKNWRQCLQQSIRNFCSGAIWMLVTIFSPEYLLSLALQDFMRGRRSVREMEDWARADGVPWTMTHARYANMGGFSFGVEGDSFRSDPLSSMNGSTISLVSLERIYGTIKDRSRVIMLSRKSLQIQDYVKSKVLQTEIPVQEIDLGDQRISHGWDDLSTKCRLSGLSPHDSIRSSQRQTLRPISTCTSLPYDPDESNGAISSSRTDGDVDAEEERRHSVSSYSSVITYQIYPNSDQLRLLRECAVIGHLPEISENAIADKSKGDSLVKTIALVQICYLIISLTTRAVKHLPITQLEIASLAFSACMLITYFFFRSKPQGVTTPTDVTGNQPIWGADLNHISDGLRKWNAFSDIKGFYFSCRPWNDSILAPPKIDLGWNEGPRFGIYDGEQYLRYVQIGITLAGTILGSVHSLAWSFEFPSSVEKLIWRVSSVIAASSLPLLLLARLYFRLAAKVGWQSLSKYHYCLYSVPCLINISYVIARFCLAALVIRSLFFLPPEAFIAIWAS